jgi:hypothetical protein
MLSTCSSIDGDARGRVARMTACIGGDLHISFTEDAMANGTAAPKTVIRSGGTATSPPHRVFPFPFSPGFPLSVALSPQTPPTARMVLPDCRRIDRSPLFAGEESYPGPIGSFGPVGVGVSFAVRLFLCLVAARDQIRIPVEIAADYLFTTPANLVHLHIHSSLG